MKITTPEPRCCYCVEEKIGSRLLILIELAYIIYFFGLIAYISYKSAYYEVYITPYEEVKCRGKWKNYGDYSQI